MAEDKSLRDDLEKIWDAHTTEGEEAAPAEEPVVAAPEAEAAEPAEVKAEEPAKEAAEPTEPAKDGRVRDDKGRFSPKAAAPDKAKAPIVTDPLAPAVEQAQPPAPVAAELKAPQSWKPAAREAFAKAPPEVQQEAIRREREVQTTLQESAKARDGWQQFQQAVGPYEALLRSEGVNAIQAVTGLMGMTYTLRTGTADQKAQLLAYHIKRFLGTGESELGLLASHLTGQTPSNASSASVDPVAIAQKVRADLKAEMQQSQMQQALSEANTEIEQFAATAPYFEDVRSDVADLIEVAAKQNRILTLKDAYDKACYLNPEIRRILEQKQLAHSAATTQQATQRAKAASSSVRSAPGGAVKAPPGDDIRSHIEKVWDELEGR